MPRRSAPLSLDDVRAMCAQGDSRILLDNHIPLDDVPVQTLRQYRGLRVWAPVEDATPTHKNTGPRYRSKTEARFAEELTRREAMDECKAWWYEPVRLWLRPGMSFTPDFVVQEARPNLLTFTPGMPATLSPALARDLGDGHAGALICYEVKASLVYEQRRAYDRLKMAAHLYPMFEFRVAQWDRKRHAWNEREVTP